MNFNKTIGVSIILHAVFFSAALLLSAGLFRGGGDNTGEKIFFVRLAENKDQTGIDKSVPEKLGTSVKKALNMIPESNNHVINETPLETVKSKTAIEKAPEPPEKEVFANDKQLDAHAVKVRTAKEAPADYGTEAFAKRGSAMPVPSPSAYSKSNGPGNNGVMSGLTPAVVELIGNAIERVKNYPALARKRGMEGTVYVSFRINESGEPDEIRIKKSSGYSILDSATIKVVEKAAPYPPVSSRIELPVAYKLRD